MFDVCCIIFSLVCCLLVSKRFGDTSWISPSVLFSFSFLPGSILLLRYVDIWNIDFSMVVFATLILGPIVFTLTSKIFEFAIVKDFVQRQKENISALPVRSTNRIDMIENWKFVLWGCVQWVCVWFVWHSIGGLIPDAESAAEMIGGFRELSDTLQISAWFIIFRKIVVASGYVSIYVLAHCIVVGKIRLRRICLILFCVLPSFIMANIQGARGGMIELLVFLLCFVILFSENAPKPRFRLTKKFYFVVAVLTLLVAVGFGLWGTLLGRHGDVDAIYYLAVYLSAPMMNLDINIKNGMYNTCDGISSNYTFFYIVERIANKLGIKEWIHPWDYVHNEINGEWIGNVPTLYQHYLHDWGFFFAMVCVIGIAILSTYVYQQSKYIVHKDANQMSMWVLVYGFFCFYLIFSFFAEYFYIRLFDSSFWFNFIAMYILRWCLTKRFILGFR